MISLICTENQYFNSCTAKFKQDVNFNSINALYNTEDSNFSGVTCMI